MGYRNKIATSAQTAILLRTIYYNNGIRVAENIDLFDHKCVIYIDKTETNNWEPLYSFYKFLPMDVVMGKYLIRFKLGIASSDEYILEKKVFNFMKYLKNKYREIYDDDPLPESIVNYNTTEGFGVIVISVDTIGNKDITHATIYDRVQVLSKSRIVEKDKLTYIIYDCIALNEKSEKNFVENSYTDFFAKAISKKINLQESKIYIIDNKKYVELVDFMPLSDESEVEESSQQTSENINNSTENNINQIIEPSWPNKQQSISETQTSESNTQEAKEKKKSLFKKGGLYTIDGGYIHISYERLARELYNTYTSNQVEGFNELSNYFSLLAGRSLVTNKFTENDITSVNALYCWRGNPISLLNSKLQGKIFTIETNPTVPASGKVLSVIDASKLIITMKQSSHPYSNINFNLYNKNTIKNSGYVVNNMPIKYINIDSTSLRLLSPSSSMASILFPINKIIHYEIGPQHSGKQNTGHIEIIAKKSFDFQAATYEIDMNSDPRIESLLLAWNCPQPKDFDILIRLWYDIQTRKVIIKVIPFVDPNVTVNLSSFNAEIVIYTIRKAVIIDDENTESNVNSNIYSKNAISLLYTDFIGQCDIYISCNEILLLIYDEGYISDKTINEIQNIYNVKLEKIGPNLLRCFL